jgi:hypothetical protein
MQTWIILAVVVAVIGLLIEGAKEHAKARRIRQIEREEADEAKKWHGWSQSMLDTFCTCRALSIDLIGHSLTIGKFSGTKYPKVDFRPTEINFQGKWRDHVVVEGSICRLGGGGADLGWVSVGSGVREPGPEEVYRRLRPSIFVQINMSDDAGFEYVLNRIANMQPVQQITIDVRFDLTSEPAVTLSISDVPNDGTLPTRVIHHMLVHESQKMEDLI